MTSRRQSPAAIRRLERRAMGAMFQKLALRFSEKREIKGLPVAVFRLCTREERAEAFEKVEAALALIEGFAPLKLDAMRQDLRSVLVAGDASAWGYYVRKLKMIELFAHYVLDEETTPESIASTLIHEAQHARLWRLGFRYDEPIRGRIERLCFQAERSFARRIPDGAAQFERAEAWMAADPELHFSNDARSNANLKVLEELGTPAWLVRFMDWVHRRRSR